MLSGVVTILIIRYTVIISYETCDVHYLNTQSTIDFTIRPFTTPDPSFVIIIIIIISYEMPSPLPINESDPSAKQLQSSKHSKCLDAR